jgi:hypothetical protein
MQGGCKRSKATREFARARLNKARLVRDSVIK